MFSAGTKRRFAAAQQNVGHTELECLGHGLRLGVSLEVIADFIKRDVDEVGRRPTTLAFFQSWKRLEAKADIIGPHKWPGFVGERKETLAYGRAAAAFLARRSSGLVAHTASFGFKMPAGPVGSATGRPDNGPTGTPHHHRVRHHAT
jgi:hypothetical protein